MNTDLPYVFPDRAAYHGDSLPLLGTVTLDLGTGAGDLADATAQLEVRDVNGRLVLAREPPVEAVSAGTVRIAETVLGPEDWTGIPRGGQPGRVSALYNYDVELRHPTIGTLTLVRGRLLVTLDVTHP